MRTAAVGQYNSHDNFIGLRSVGDADLEGAIVRAHKSGVLVMQGNIERGADTGHLLIGGDDGVAAADGRADGLAGLWMQHRRGMLQLAVCADKAALAVGFHSVGAQQFRALARQQIAEILAVFGQLA